MLTSLITNFAAGGCTEPVFFGFKAWYHYIHPKDANCNPTDFKVLEPNGQSDFLLIGLALVDDLLRLAAFVAIGFVIYGGFLYINSEGAPDQAIKARDTIQNALIGLVIAVISVGIVSFIGSKVG